jgi:hypothetical protein
VFCRCRVAAVLGEPGNMGCLILHPCCAFSRE